MFNRNFITLWSEQFFFMASFQLLSSAMPLYAKSLGAGAVEIGLLITLFAIAAMVMRLVFGWQAGLGRAIPILIFGAFIYAICSAGYILVNPLAEILNLAPIFLILALRPFHGIGMATTTACQTLVIELAPAERKGEALGMISLATSLGGGFFPAIGMMIVLGGGYTTLYLTSTALAVIALVIALFVKHPHSSVPRLPIPPSFNRAALVPAICIFTMMFAYGSVAAFLPLHAVQSGLENPGWYFTVSALATLVAQTLTGKLSDRFGRTTLVIPGLGLVCLGMILVSILPGWWLLLAGVVAGLGSGGTSPVLMAWASDLVPPQQQGNTMAMMGLAFEIGIASASFLTGLLAGSFSFGQSFLMISVVPFLGLLLAVASNRRQQKARA